MKKRLSLALALALAAGAVLAAGSASAATVFGSPCAANEIAKEPGAVWISTAHPEGPYPVAAPSSGVITEWLINAALGVKTTETENPRIYQQRLVVVRPEGTSLKVVGEASGGTLNTSGTSTYLTRIPVQQGDLLGIAGNPFTAYCKTTAKDTFDWTIGGTPVGSTFKPASSVGLQVPIVARIEPDVDGDGYGDETQDQCPQSAAYQTPCPSIQVSSLSLTSTKSVSIYVTSSQLAPVAVSGTVNLGKGKTATLSAATITVTPGTFARYQLTFTKPVLNALKALSPKKSLELSVTASATNVAGAVSTAASTLKLPGQAKPKPKRVRHKKRTNHKRAKHKPAKHNPAKTKGQKQK